VEGILIQLEKKPVGVHEENKKCKREGFDREKVKAVSIYC
jgi:hypothetical protein